MKVLFLAAFILGACSQGAINDNYDRYLNVFGLHYVDPPTDHGGYLGRVLQSDGRAATFSQVHARPLVANGSSPAVTTTNGKGGFYLGGLNPGKYRVFIMAPSGEGLVQEVDVGPNAVIEDENILLQPLARVSGRAILEDEPVHTGIVIYALGTPFSAFTDHEGGFFMDLPAGSYEFRAEKDGYMTYQSPEPVAVEGEVPLDFELAANPWPAGRVTIESEDGFIVRGRKVRLNIEPVPGVRYMKVEGGRVSTQESGWTKVKSSVELEHHGDGFNRVQVQFMDAYGKRSEPVAVNYYNTTLDRSWKILHGYITDPVRIRTGSKVYFLAFESYIGSSSGDVTAPIPYPGGATDVEDEPIVVEPGEPPASEEPDDSDGELPDLVDGTLALLQDDNEADADDASSTMPGAISQEDEADAYFVSEVVTFLADVVIEEGVQIKGAAHFRGRLESLGTSEQPVVWQGPTDQYLVSEISGDQASLQWVEFRDVRMRVTTSTDSQFAGDSLLMKNTDFNFLGYNSYAGGPSTMVLKRSDFVDSQIGFRCAAVLMDGSLDLGHSEVAPGFAQLAIEASVFQGSTLDMGCYSEPPYAARYRISRNNFLNPAGYYLLSSSNYNSTTGALPSDDVWDAVLTENHFRNVDRQYEGVEEFGWRFGENVVEPLTGVGRPAQ